MESLGKSLILLQKEHALEAPLRYRRLSIEQAAFTMALEAPELQLLRYTAQGLGVRKIARLMQLKVAQVKQMAEDLAQKLRLKQEDLKLLARDFAKYAA